MFDEGKGLSTEQQQYDLKAIINEVRGQVDSWRALLACPLQRSHSVSHSPACVGSPWPALRYAPVSPRTGGKMACGAGGR